MREDHVGLFVSAAVVATEGASLFVVVRRVPKLVSPDTTTRALVHCELEERLVFGGFQSEVERGDGVVSGRMEDFGELVIGPGRSGTHAVCLSGIARSQTVSAA